MNFEYIWESKMTELADASVQNLNRVDVIL